MPALVLPQKQIKDALVKARGRVATAASALKVSRSAIYSAIDRDPEIKELVDDLRERRIDFAEDVLDDAVANRDLTAVIFLLKTLGQSRGYIQAPQIVVQQREIVICDAPDWRKPALDGTSRVLPEPPAE